MQVTFSAAKAPKPGPNAAILKIRRVPGGAFPDAPESFARQALNDALRHVSQVGGFAGRHRPGSSKLAQLKQQPQP